MNRETSHIFYHLRNIISETLLDTIAITVILFPIVSAIIVAAEYSLSHL